MKNDWLAASSFERTHEIVSAINALSIHAKLTLAKVDRTGDAEKVRDARSRLTEFLDEFSPVLRETEASHDHAIMGTDPRLSELALRFLSARRRWPQPSVLFTTPLTRVRDLLWSERPEDLPTLISCLEGLRLLVEQNSHADVLGILGDI